MTNILRYWPDVTPGEFTTLREVAQEIQRQKDAGEPVPDELQDLPRMTAIKIAAQLVRDAETRKG